MFNKQQRCKFWKFVDINTELLGGILNDCDNLLIIPLLLKFIIKNKCWEWKGSFDKDGYGKIFCKAAHRFSWIESRNNENIKGAIIMHVCDNPSCVNPFHLRKGTYQKNSDDMVKKGRSLFGEKHIDAILKEKDIPIILQKLYNGNILADIAFEYNVNEATIYEIYVRNSWKHITKDYPQEFFNRIRNNLKNNRIRNKITEEDVKKIKEFFKQGYKKSHIAKMYGLGPTTIANIINGKSWSNTN